MPKLISIGKEMLKISSDWKKLEYSMNKGQTWSTRASLSGSYGVPTDLLEYKNEILMLTDKHVMYSKNNGITWNMRASLSSSFGIPQTLSDGGKELLMTTNKKLLYSTNNGSTWNLRKNF